MKNHGAMTKRKNLKKKKKLNENERKYQIEGENHVPVFTDSSSPSVAE